MQYEIKGTPFPVVVCSLEKGETMVAENGAMTWMDETMEMETKGGGIGSMFARAFSGETMFQNIFTAKADGRIAFGTCFPGEIRALEISPEREIILQKRSFLASEPTVSRTTHFNKKLGVGFFGGEGFIMQRFSGQGLLFVEVDGSLVEYTLAPGQTMLVNSGNIAAFESSVQMEIQEVKGLKNKLLSGEGFFHTKLTGPGKIWLQTMPLSGLANALIPYMPTTTSSSSS